MSEKWTKGPWEICWCTYDSRKVNFTITASPYGSIRPIAETNWKTDWSEVEGEELIANAQLIVSAPDLAKALEAATHALRSYQYGNASTELAMSVADFCDVALAKARGEVK